MRKIGLLLALLVPAAAQGITPDVRVLIVSGANNHDWEWTTPSLRRILEESGRFAVDVTTAPAQDLARPGVLDAVDVVLLDYNGPRWGDAAEAAFLAAVERGVGVSVIHAANNAFPGWVEYEALVGDLWRDGTGHGRFHPFDVVLQDRDHPVTATLPDLRDHPDELYHRLVRAPGANHRCCGDAFSDPETGGTGAREPMVLVGSYGAGRVFHTPLGHVWRGDVASRASHDDPQFRNLVVRGTEWAATGRVRDGLEQPNRLTAAEAKDGWRLLFDGATTRGWRARSGGGFPESGWEVVSGCLRHTSGGGDLESEDTFTDFELAFEWKVARGVNSGVKVRIPDGPGGAVGPEYQLLDDRGTDEDENPIHAAAALYDLVPPADKHLATTGAFNQSRIVWRGAHFEHWLNGTLVCQGDTDSADFAERKARSKFAPRADFAAAAPGHVVLQDHGGEVWFRSIRIRALDEAPARSLLDGPGLSGWTATGGAEWWREGRDIVGRVPGVLAHNAFLCTKDAFADFVFDVELRVEQSGNSGIQFRSHESDQGVVFGYQAEIDCTERAWSGGIYDESRRAWIADLSQNPAGRAAFREDEWNHYRIEARGDRLRVWVNGVPTADLRDGADAEGFFAFQVHGGVTGRFRWRDPRIRAR